MGHGPLIFPVLELNSMVDVKRVFFPLGETNLLESSSSRHETDENDKLLIFPIQLHDQTEILISGNGTNLSPSLCVVRSLKCRSFNEDILRSTNLDLQSQTQTTNLPRDHEALDYEIKLNTLKHSFA